ncbi:hypothetical protein ACVIGA_000628 [Bradyrhizobium sp. USDA 3240]
MRGVHCESRVVRGSYECDCRAQASAHRHPHRRSLRQNGMTIIKRTLSSIFAIVILLGGICAAVAETFSACKDNVLTLATGYNIQQVICLRMFQTMTGAPANAAVWYIDGLGGINHLPDVRGARCYSMTAPVWELRVGAFSTTTFSYVWVFAYDRREQARGGDPSPPAAAAPPIPQVDPCLPDCLKVAPPPLTDVQRKAGYSYTCYWQGNGGYSRWELLSPNGMIFDRKTGRPKPAP